MAAMPVVSSDPHAHLRPVYRRLASDRTFALVSTEAQFALLVEAEDVRRLAKREAERLAAKHGQG